MFDFFKDTYNEYRGIDVQKVKQEKRKQQDEEKSKRFIFTKKSKLIVIILGALYLVVAALMISSMVNAKTGVAMVLIYSVLSVIDIFTIISLIVGKRTGEIAGLVGISAFILLLFFSSSFM